MSSSVAARNPAKCCAFQAIFEVFCWMQVSEFLNFPPRPKPWEIQRGAPCTLLLTVDFTLLNVHHRPIEQAVTDQEDTCEALVVLWASEVETEPSPRVTILCLGSIEPDSTLLNFI